MSETNFFKLSSKEIARIYNSKNHRSYYDEHQMGKQYDGLKSKLIDLYIKIKDDENFRIESLTN